MSTLLRTSVHVHIHVIIRVAIVMILVQELQLMFIKTSPGLFESDVWFRLACTNKVSDLLFMANRDRT